MLKTTLILIAVSAPCYADQFTLEYPDDGTSWYYINQTTGRCEQLPEYIATPIKYSNWVHANNGQISNFRVMPNNPGGHWVEFIATSSAGVNIQVDMVQPYGDCQMVLDLQVQNGIIPNAPDAPLGNLRQGN